MSKLLISRVIASLVAVVAILQLVHLVLLNQLESRRLDHLEQIQQQWSRNEELFVGKDEGRNRRDIVKKPHLTSSTILDSSGQYQIYFDVSGPIQNFLKPSDDFAIDDEMTQKPPPSQDLTLVTYSDLHGAQIHLKTLLKRWKGPISLVLYSNNSVEDALSFINCSGESELVNFHVVVPFGESKKELNEYNCEKSEIFEISSQFPTNLLRNVGRKRVHTKHSLVIPINLLPSPGLRSKFNQMIRSRDIDKKTVFVLSSFETRGVVPENKEKLVKLLKNYEARPLTIEGKIPSDFGSWTTTTATDLPIIYEVLWKEPWAPFFISENSVPLYDEGFKGTMDRLSQLCELHVAGYKFGILNEGFLVHSGYTISGSRNGNKGKFRLFKKELRDKYPHSTRRCY